MIREILDLNLEAELQSGSEIEIEPQVQIENGTLPLIETGLMTEGIEALLLVVVKFEGAGVDLKPEVEEKPEDLLLQLETGRLLVLQEEDRLELKIKGTVLRVVEGKDKVVVEVEQQLQLLQQQPVLQRVSVVSKVLPLVLPPLLKLHPPNQPLQKQQQQHQEQGLKLGRMFVLPAMLL